MKIKELVDIILRKILLPVLDLFLLKMHFHKSDYIFPIHHFAANNS